jgi:EipB-like
MPLAAEIVPHRALYSMTLGSVHNDSEVTDAKGVMVYQWGETCDGWTIEQRYRLKLHYSGAGDTDVVSRFITWESKDGLRYRFSETETRNGTVSEDIGGEARLDGPGKGGVARFSKPRPETMPLAPGVLFPSAHTILLIDRARAGATFVSRQVFDGSAEENAVQVSAFIAAKPTADRASAKLDPLLQRPGWRVRLAFFPADAKADVPDYELGMMLLDNGVSRDMDIDYGDYTIRAKLDDIEALAKPKC